ncbi:thiamine-triphosphatase isoform X2 [Chanos chanos]|nr:thiamine-triphosphatase isoform X2 [Chanos chanos]
MSVEIERKFVCNPDIQELLTAIGAVCTGARKFRDQYFDTRDLDLTLKDFWLRRREGTWELKCPTTRGASGTDEKIGARPLCTHYREITNLSQIQYEIREIMSKNRTTKRNASESCCQGELKIGETEGSRDGASGDDEWLKNLSLQCFADFTTARCSYLLEVEGEQGGVRIDLDQADFGYCVGEIEVLVPDGGDTQSALQRISATAEKLGLRDEKRVEGKMHVYLQRYRPDHYRQLLSTHIL